MRYATGWHSALFGLTTEVEVATLSGSSLSGYYLNRFGVSVLNIGVVSNPMGISLALSAFLCPDAVLHARTVHTVPAGLQRSG